MRSPKLPSRQWKFSVPQTVTKWLASGPSMNTSRMWKRRVEKIGPYSSYILSRRAKRVAHEVARAPQVEVVWAGREAAAVGALGPEIGGDLPQRVGAEVFGGPTVSLPSA